VHIAEQRNQVSGQTEPVRFQVPAQSGNNRFSTSLLIPARSDRARRAPEYVNIRHRVTRRADGSFQLEDMAALPEPQFSNQLAAGNYEAAHFIDHMCDGALVARVGGLPVAIADFAGYSLVTAPDFFPLADQMEITNWVRQDLANRQEQFAQGSPDPLCEGRHLANLELPRPDRMGDKAFSRTDETLVAVVSARPASRQTHAPKRLKRFASYLTDAASNVFAPGWDISLGANQQDVYYAAYGLGSPFPEDSKLCAALNSFWPAVAPDASRTFRIRNAPTAMPLLNSELGFHPRDPRVIAGAVQSTTGWDGEHGPFLETVGDRTFVNHADFGRSDYVSNALNGTLKVALTAGIDADELIRRMEALRTCIATLPPASDAVNTTPLWLVTVEAVPDWAADPGRADATLVGAGYVYEFVRADGAGEPAMDTNRRRVPVADIFTCQIAAEVIFFRRGQGPWQSVPVA